jgi:hypothetical protein
MGRGECSDKHVAKRARHRMTHWRALRCVEPATRPGTERPVVTTNPFWRLTYGNFIAQRCSNKEVATVRVIARTPVDISNPL